MPEKRTLERARRKARQGKSASTVAGEFVREEIEDIRKGKRAGVPLAGKGKRTRKRASAARIHGRAVSRSRSRATARALRREPRRSASHRALSRQAHRTASRRSAADRRRSARKAARTRQARR